MKLIHVLPTAKLKGRFKTLLKQKELDLRGSNTTLYRYAEGHWKHKKFKGNIWWEEGLGGVLDAQIESHDQESETKLLESFVGYLDRHLGRHIELVSISYR